MSKRKKHEMWTCINLFVMVYSNKPTNVYHIVNRKFRFKRNKVPFIADYNKYEMQIVAL